jgi:hypothetical protein
MRLGVVVCNESDAKKAALIGDYHNLARYKVDGKCINTLNIWKEILISGCEDMVLPLLRLLHKQPQYKSVYSNTLRYACQSGNVYLVKRAYNLGFRDYSNGLIGACIGGSIELANNMFGYVQGHFSHSVVKQCYQHICEGTNKEMFHWFRDKFNHAKYTDDRRNGIEYALPYNTEMAIYISAVEYPPPVSNSILLDLLRLGCRQDNLEFVKYMLELHGYRPDVITLLLGSISYAATDERMIKFLIDLDMVEFDDVPMGCLAPPRVITYMVEHELKKSTAVPDIIYTKICNKASRCGRLDILKLYAAYVDQSDNLSNAITNNRENIAGYLLSIGTKCDIYSIQLPIYPYCSALNVLFRYYPEDTFAYMCKINYPLVKQRALSIEPELLLKYHSLLSGTLYHDIDRIIYDHKLR